MNPFIYQGPVPRTHLIDRRAELDALQSAAVNRVAIRLAAPRRFGKSSLLEAHVAAMREAGHRAVRVDFSKVATVGDVAARVAHAYRDLPAEPGRTVRRWASRLGVTAAPGGMGISVAPAPPRLGPDEARTALLDLLDVPRTLFEADGELTVVCFDEFQDLLVADDSLDGLMRSVIQHHVESAAYVFAGSQPSLMQALFSEYERPFYGQARPLTLPTLPVAEAAEDIEAMLVRDRLNPASAVDELLVFSGGHPQRTILLAHHLYELLDGGNALEDPAAAAVDLALSETADALQAVWDGLDRNERVVILALGDGQAPAGSIVAEQHRIPRSSLRDALLRLVADQQLVAEDEAGRPYLLDPLLAEWLRRR
ncbi:MAG TPA: hypothetical protein VIT89_11450 [Solirubrobacterales bacterium]